MQSPTIPFRPALPRLEEQLSQFNARKEVNWFGFRGSFKNPDSAVITFTKFEAGLQGGGGTAALAFQAHVVRSAKNFSFAEGLPLSVRRCSKSTPGNRYGYGGAGALGAQARRSYAPGV